MRYKLISMLSILLTALQGAQAQEISVNIKDGKIVLSNTGTFERISPTDKFSVDFDNPKNAIPNSSSLLNNKFAQTLRNLQDDSLYLKSFYTKIWDESTVDAYKTGLTQIQEKKPYRDLPDWFPTKLWSYYETVYPEIHKESFVKTSQDIKINITYQDPLKAAIIKSYNDDFLTQATEVQDIDYIKGWRTLEQLFADYVALSQDLVNKFDSGVIWAERKEDGSYRCSKKEELVKRLEQELCRTTNNRVITLLRSERYKQWLWLTEGIPTINPLSVSDPSTAYPATEKFSFKDEVKVYMERLKKQSDDIRQVDFLRNVIVFPYRTSTSKVWTWHANYSPDLSILGLDQKKFK